MNKGLRPRAGRVQFLDKARQGENSDLMNKGLRLKDGVVIEVLLTPNERILT